MSRLASVQRSGPVKPVRVMIYGIEGVGKSTFGANAPKPIFITPEGGVDEIANAVCLPNISSFDDVSVAVKELIAEKHSYETLVLDSAGWIEKLCHAKIIGTSGRSIITANGGYGAGYRESERLHCELIEQLSILREKRNMNIVVTAHYQVKIVKDPEAAQDYDAFEIKCHEMVSSLWREWVDCLLFARFKTYIKKNDEKDRGQAFSTGERVMYTEKRPAFQAKNRYSLPFELEVSWDQFMKARLGGKEETTVETVAKQVSELFAKVSDTEMRKKVMTAIESAQGNAPELIKIRDRLRQVVAA